MKELIQNIFDFLAEIPEIKTIDIYKQQFDYADDLEITFPTVFMTVDQTIQGCIAESQVKILVGFRNERLKPKSLDFLDTTKLVVDKLEENNFARTRQSLDHSWQGLTIVEIDFTKSICVC